VLIVVGSPGGAGSGVACGAVVSTGGADCGMACGAVGDPPPHALIVISNPAAVTHPTRRMNMLFSPPPAPGTVPGGRVDYVRRS
jgi:hypothetical protein